MLKYFNIYLFNLKNTPETEKKIHCETETFVLLRLKKIKDIKEFQLKLATIKHRDLYLVQSWIDADK